MSVDSWSELDSAEADSVVDLAGVVATRQFRNSHDGERLQQLRVDEPPNETLGDVPRNIVLLTPVGDRPYKIGEVVSFTGRVISTTNDIVSVESETDSVSSWFDDGELSVDE